MIGALLRSAFEAFARMVKDETEIDRGTGPLASCVLCSRERRDINDGTCAPCTSQAW